MYACWIAQIEQQLIFAERDGDGDGDGREAPAKRRKTGPGGPGKTAYPVMPEAQGAEADWNALAEVYSRLGMDHLANLTYFSHVARQGFEP